MISKKQYLETVVRIVIKLGSSLLTQKNKISISNIKKYANLINQLYKEKKEVILVTSGAVASANLSVGKAVSLPMKQALASIGQVRLMEIYKQVFQSHSIPVAQILLSEHSLNNRISYLNARNTIHTLLENKVLPIINENDPLATAELTFGDNDVLGAIVTGLIGADIYIVFSNVDGFYLNYRKKNQMRLSIIEKIDSSIEAEASGPSRMGTGGMETKLKAAKIASQFGIPTLILSGKGKALYEDIFYKESGTFFVPSNKQINHRKKWIVSGINLPGKIVIDPGAEEAILMRHSSLLPRGIFKIMGNFHVGDNCLILNKKK